MRALIDDQSRQATHASGTTGSRFEVFGGATRGPADPSEASDFERLGAT
jgi:hypothetical protein